MEPQSQYVYTQFHFKKTCESLFQTSVKAFRLQEGEETILVFDNHSDNQQS